ncbi:hypothetical protein Anapl_06439 [Anas platyrhynchos]|uniref:Uncharacterized protein n=1 Tax=Anas platyrhynchos TaxID=8839 RepID=R0LRS0_ANAPL|nr:hypothetical protein Anapl_06439 [Anas platyrhynchos]
MAEGPGGEAKSPNSSPPAKVSDLMSHSLSDKLPFRFLADVSLQSARELAVAAVVPPVGHFPRPSPPFWLEEGSASPLPKRQLKEVSSVSLTKSHSAKHIISELKPVMKPYYRSLSFMCRLRQLSLRTLTIITNRYVTFRQAKPLGQQKHILIVKFWMQKETPTMEVYSLTSKNEKRTEDCMGCKGLLGLGSGSLGFFEEQRRTTLVQSCFLASVRSKTALKKFFAFFPTQCVWMLFIIKKELRLEKCPAGLEEHQFSKHYCGGKLITPSRKTDAKMSPSAAAALLHYYSHIRVKGDGSATISAGSPDPAQAYTMQPSEEDALELLASHALLKIPANKDMPALLLTPLRSNCCPSSAIRKHSSGILSASPSHSRQQPLDPDTDTAFTLLIEQKHCERHKLLVQQIMQGTRAEPAEAEQFSEQ